MTDAAPQVQQTSGASSSAAQFRWTAKQEEAGKLLAGPATHILLAGGGRCVAGDTVLDGQTLTIKQLAERGEPVKVRTSWGEQWAEAPWRKGRTILMEVTLESGRRIEVTPDHRFWDGTNWVKAETLKAGLSCVAVRVHERPPAFDSNLLESTSERGLSGFRASVRRLMRIVAGWTDRCCAYLRRYGQPPLHEAVGVPGGRASRSGGLARIHEYRRFQIHAFGWPGSGIREVRPLRRAAGGSLFCPGWFRPSTKDDSSPGGFRDGSGCLCGERTFAQSLGSLQADQQSVGRSSLLQSIAGLWESWCALYGQCVYRVFRLFGLSCDVPFSLGYSLERVLIISSSTEKDYYTLHVPVSEQYFANGILHHNSGKTARIIRQIVMRAVKAPGSRHLITRLRFNHLRASIVNGTFPWVMERCFPGINYRLDRLDWFCRIDTGAEPSEIWFCGLDEKERTEKVLGMEFGTIFPNECSQIPYSSILLVRTRLAQKVMQRDGRQLPLKMFYDENPPSKAHWSYKLFVQGRDPDSGASIPDPQRYAWLKMNPIDNAENLPAETIEEYMNLPGRMRKRFWEGEFSEVVEGALFTAEMLDANRVTHGELPQMVRIVVAVDPMGARPASAAQPMGEADRKATGIIIAGLGTDGVAYWLEDCTVSAMPGVWGNVAVSAYDRHEADCIVGEVNYGGTMVEHTIRTVRSGIPYKNVVATRGKHLRAEPVSSLMEKGKVRIVGHMRRLEDEAEAMSETGYMGDGSPNRLDAAVMATMELFPSIVQERKKSVGNVAYMPTRNPMAALHGRRR